MQDLAFPQLVAEAQACRACPRMEGRRRVLSSANGPLTAQVLFVAEAPGRWGGDKSGIPLSADGDASGRNFARYLQAAGMRREEVFVTNAALCNPRKPDGTNAPPSQAELRRCSPFLRHTLEAVRPAIIVTLGNKALAALQLIAPHAISLRAHAATAVPWADYTLFPLYHPSPQVAVSPTGRAHEAQEADYRALRLLLNAVPQRNNPGRSPENALGSGKDADGCIHVANPLLSIPNVSQNDLPGLYQCDNDVMP